MTAAWGVTEAMPAGVAIEPASQSSYFLTERKARELTDNIRRDLAGAVIGLQLAREGHAHLALGYAAWHLYVLEEFGDIKELRLPVEERRALVASMCETGASVTDIVKAIGFSRGTVQADRVALGLSAAQPAGQVIDLHEPEPNPYEGMNRTMETLARVRDQGDRGLTSLELDDDTGWPIGTGTGNLSKLDKRRGWVRLTDQRRRNRGAYVITDAGRAALEEN